MLCEKCNKNEARINLVKIVNGEKHQIWLCENCARDISEVPFLKSMGQELNSTFEGILTGLLSNIENTTVKQNEMVCFNCGLTYAEFSKHKKVGCNNCYNTFSNILKPIIKRIHSETKHIGKIPKIDGKKIMQRRTIRDLKEELQKLIVSEEYEKAAVIRDKINELEVSIREDIIKEKGLHVKEEKCNEKLDS